VTLRRRDRLSAGTHAAGCRLDEAVADSGELATDTRLPGELELAEQYGVSRDTIRRAVQIERFTVAGRLVCNTTYMAYHEAYWVAIATAAPVIALANTVSITDAVNFWLSVKARRRGSVPGAWYVTVLFWSVCNIAIQLMALILALLSLLNGKDSDTIIAFMSMVAGFVFVLLTVLANAKLRYGVLEEQNTANGMEC
jgi:hypothetical protein